MLLFSSVLGSFFLFIRMSICYLLSNCFPCQTSFLSLSLNLAYLRLCFRHKILSFSVNAFYQLFLPSFPSYQSFISTRVSKIGKKGQHSPFPFVLPLGSLFHQYYIQSYTQDFDMVLFSSSYRRILSSCEFFHFSLEMFIPIK